MTITPVVDGVEFTHRHGSTFRLSIREECGYMLHILISRTEAETIASAIMSGLQDFDVTIQENEVGQ